MAPAPTSLIPYTLRSSGLSILRINKQELLTSIGDEHTKYHDRICCPTITRSLNSTNDCARNCINIQNREENRRDFIFPWCPWVSSLAFMNWILIPGERLTILVCYPWRRESMQYRGMHMYTENLMSLTRFLCASQLTWTIVLTYLMPGIPKEVASKDDVTIT